MMKVVSGHGNALQMIWWSLSAFVELALFWLHYVLSFVARTSFHRHVDEIYRQVLPSDYTRVFRVAWLAIKALLTGKSINSSKKRN
jgi:hypothetical protein